MATTFLVTKNRAVSTLASGIDNAVTSLDVAAGEGAKFPSTYPFHITIDDEIMSCTNRSTDALTVVRAQQGTSASSHNTGASVSLNITAKNVSDLNTAVNAIENQVAYGRLDGWTSNKLLKGAGAGSNPTEIDVPTGMSATTGSYVGAGGDQTIAHGLGTTPIIVFITKTDEGNLYAGWVEATRQRDFGGDADSVTAMNATNFYVRGNFTWSSNTFHFIAIG